MSMPMYPLPWATPPWNQFCCILSMAFKERFCCVSGEIRIETCSSQSVPSSLNTACLLDSWGKPHYMIYQHAIASHFSHLLMKIQTTAHMSSFRIMMERKTTITWHVSKMMARKFSNITASCCSERLRYADSDLGKIKVLPVENFVSANFTMLITHQEQPFKTGENMWVKTLFLMTTVWSNNNDTDLFGICYMGFAPLATDAPPCPTQRNWRTVKLFVFTHHFAEDYVESNDLIEQF